MIYITGDTHVPIDVEKLNEDLFPEQKDLSRSDYVIVCGDFGGVWDDSERHRLWLEWLSERPFTLLFADGNHENYDMLEKYPEAQWNGGKVHVVADNILHLTRGQVFIIDGKCFFVMGGAVSRDRFTRTEGRSWWRREMPDDAEFKEGLKNLGEVGFDVDYIITHTAPTTISSKFYSCAEEKPLGEYLQYISDTVKFKKWFFGHVHCDMEINDRFIALYDRIYDLEAGKMLDERCKGYGERDIPGENPTIRFF